MRLTKKGRHWVSWSTTAKEAKDAKKSANRAESLMARFIAHPNDLIGPLLMAASTGAGIAFARAWDVLLTAQFRKGGLE